MDRRDALKIEVIMLGMMFLEACGGTKQEHVYATSNWGKIAGRHVLVVSGYPEKGGDMSESAGSKTIEPFAELERKGEAGAQVFTGEYLPNIDDRAKKIAEMLKAASGQVTLITYSFGNEELRVALTKGLISEEGWKKVTKIIIANPIAGNETAKGALAVAAGFYGIPNEDDYVKQMSPWLVEKEVVVSVSQPDKDTLVDTAQVRLVFGRIPGVTIDPDENRGHGISQKRLNQMILMGQ